LQKLHTLPKLSYCPQHETQVNTLSLTCEHGDMSVLATMTLSQFRIIDRPVVSGSGFARM